MLNPSQIHPINNYHLIQLEHRNEGRLIHLAGERQLGSARRGKCVRSDKWRTDLSVLVSHGGIPVADAADLVMVPGSGVISAGGELQEPYVHISPIELVRSELIITPEVYNYSGWYEIIEIFEQDELAIGDIVLPIYGTPRLEMEDNTEDIPIDGIGVMQC